MLFFFLPLLLTPFASALPHEDTDRPSLRITRFEPPNHSGRSPPAVSVPVLKPRHPVDHDSEDFKHFKPGTNGKFYYSHPHQERACRHLCLH